MIYKSFWAWLPENASHNVTHHPNFQDVWIDMPNTHSQKTPVAITTGVTFFTFLPKPL